MYSSVNKYFLSRNYLIIFALFEPCSSMHLYHQLVPIKVSIVPCGQSLVSIITCQHFYTLLSIQRSTQMSSAPKISPLRFFASKDKHITIKKLIKLKY